MAWHEAARPDAKMSNVAKYLGGAGIAAIFGQALYNLIATFGRDKLHNRDDSPEAFLRNFGVGALSLSPVLRQTQGAANMALTIGKPDYEVPAYLKDQSPMAENVLASKIGTLGRNLNQFQNAVRKDSPTDPEGHTDRVSEYGLKTMSNLSAITTGIDPEKLTNWKKFADKQVYRWASEDDKEKGFWNMEVELGRHGWDMDNVIRRDRSITKSLDGRGIQQKAEKSLTKVGLDSAIASYLHMTNSVSRDLINTASKAHFGKSYDDMSPEGQKTVLKKLPSILREYLDVDTENFSKVMNNPMLRLKGKSGYRADAYRGEQNLRED
jgi:hypothetical protein